MSKTKIILNPLFGYLQHFVEELPLIFDKEGEIIYQERNTLKSYKIGDIEIVAKSFRSPIFFNRIAYTFFRKSKACRSYEHGLELLKRDCGTPTPVAFIEINKGGLLKESFYLSLYEKDSQHVRDYMDGSIRDENLLKAFAEFTARIHEQGIYHIDYSPGNILFSKNPDSSFNFSLIDINRLTFKNLTLKERLKNFERLCISKEVSTIIANWYAYYAKLDKEKTITGINHYCDHFFGSKACHWAKKSLKKKEGKLKAFIGPIQKYKLIKTIRLLLKKDPQKSTLFQQEYLLYDKYIRCDDLRQVLKQKYGYK